MKTLAVILMLSAAVGHAEVIDRIGVTVGDSVITTSEIKAQLRVAALIDGKPLKLDESALRQAADRLIEQTLIRREMLLGDYSPAAPESVEPVLANLKRDRFSDNDAMYRAALKQYGVSESELKEQLLWQITLLQFVDLRFKPGVQVPIEDIRAYYRDTYLPRWRNQSNAQPPTIGQVRDAIEKTLAQQQLDSLLDRWLNAARTQLSIIYRDAAFREAVEGPQ